MQTSLLILLFNTVLFSLAFLPATALAFFSPMVFDAPGSDKDTGIILYFWSILTFPIIVLIALSLSWILYRQGYCWWAANISFLPWINTTLLVVAFKVFGMVI